MTPTSLLRSISPEAKLLLLGMTALSLCPAEELTAPAPHAALHVGELLNTSEDEERDPSTISTGADGTAEQLSPDAGIAPAQLAPTSRPGCWGHSEFPTSPVQPASPLTRPAPESCVKRVLTDVPLAEGKPGKLRTEIYRLDDGYLFITEDLSLDGNAPFYISDISFGQGRTADGGFFITIGPSYNAYFTPLKSTRRGIGWFKLSDQHIFSHHPNSTAVTFEFRICDADDRALTTFAVEVKLPPLPQESATLAQIPVEVKQEMIQALTDCPYEPLITENTVYTWKRHEGGRISHKHTGSHALCGGWVAQFELDLVGDATPERAWLIIPPLSAGTNYYRTLFVYDAHGNYLFPAPVQILHSVKKGTGSVGHTTSRHKSTYASIGRDEWSISADGVTMVSRDILDELTPTAQQGPVVETLRRYTRQGIFKNSRTITPDSPFYRAGAYEAARAAVEHPASEAEADASPCVVHLAALSDLLTAAQPKWISARGRSLNQLTRWAEAYPDITRAAQALSAQQLIRRLKQSLAPSISNPTSHIPHSTSHIQHPTSYIQHPTSNILHPTSYILHPTSNIQHPTSNILHPTSYIQHPTSYIPHPTSIFLDRA